jgi:hypothetical protein
MTANCKYNFLLQDPEIFHNICFNCCYEKTFKFQLTLPKALSAVMKGSPKTTGSGHMNGFPKATEVDNFSLNFQYRFAAAFGNPFKWSLAAFKNFFLHSTAHHVAINILYIVDNDFLMANRPEQYDAPCSVFQKINISNLNPVCDQEGCGVSP